MTTLHIPSNLPGPANYDEIRSCPIRSRIDNMTILAGLNPPPVDARNMILHVSDTPFTMYQYLRRAIRRLCPAWIVHTGDLVDNIKLEHRPSLLDFYKKKVSILLEIFEEAECEAILLTGNHDHLPTLLDLTKGRGVQVWSKSGKFYIGRHHFKAGHYFEDVATDSSEYNLFGHNLAQHTGIDCEGRFFLNGIEAMNLIHMETGDVIPIKYPPGTNNARLERKRVGL